jgi:hypothetical protein
VILRAPAFRLLVSLAGLAPVTLADIGFVNCFRFANLGGRARLSRRIPK